MADLQKLLTLLDMEEKLKDRPDLSLFLDDVKGNIKALVDQKKAEKEAAAAPNPTLRHG